jgi:hypothetical protein
MFDPGDDADEQDGDAEASASATNPSTRNRANMSLEVNISARIPHAEGVVRPGVAGHATGSRVTCSSTVVSAKGSPSKSPC